MEGYRRFVFASGSRRGKTRAFVASAHDRSHQQHYSQQQKGSSFYHSLASPPSAGLPEPAADNLFVHFPVPGCVSPWRIVFDAHSDQSSAFCHPFSSLVIFLVYYGKLMIIIAQCLFFFQPN
jgi:hypothetical protein